MALEPIDWEDVLDNYKDFIDPDLLTDLEVHNKPISWRNIEAEELPLADVQLEGSLLVQCTESAAPGAPAVPVAPTAPAISPPATGDGGYSSGSQAISWWLALPLGLGGALLAGGLALRRRAL